MPGLCALLLPLAAASEAPLCTCDQASKDPLAKEYAYRSGICAGSPRQLGAGDETTVCQYAVHAEYNKNGRFNGAEPENFNASSVDRYPVFNGVSHVRLPAGVVTEQWSCRESNGCGDCDPAHNPRQCSDERGYAYLWVPDGANSSTPRILYVHGGSWRTGSPESASYAPFCAMIAKTAKMPVLALDYTLTPVGNFSVILRQIGRALHWLATHEPLAIVAGGPAAAAEASTALNKAPMLFVAGDSSGGGSAASALLAQASAGLPGAAGAVLSGGVLFSPWLNLPCDTPSYASQIFTLEDVHTREEPRTPEQCRIPGLDGQGKLAKVAIGGDVAYAGYPHSLSASFADTGGVYAGSAAMAQDPVASPMKALPSTLARLPPVQVHVGVGEVLASENVIFASKMAGAGGACELHTYDQMWHDFTMYYEGCDHPRVSKLLFAYSSLNLTATFLNRLAENAGQVPWRRNGAPFSWTHYEYPIGVDTAMEPYYAALHRPPPRAFEATQQMRATAAPKRRLSVVAGLLLSTTFVLLLGTARSNRPARIAPPRAPEAKVRAGDPGSRNAATSPASPRPSTAILLCAW